MDEYYRFFLDLFPLTDEIAPQNNARADLGYLDLDVLGFLIKELKRC